MKLNHSQKYKNVIQGGGLFAVGIFSGYFLQFIAGIVIVRILTMGEYGDFALANSMIALLSVFCLAGMPIALVKFISQDKRKQNNTSDEINYVIGSSVSIVLLMNIIVIAIVLCVSEMLARKLESTHLSHILTVLIFTLPINCTVALMSAYFRSQNNALPKVLFEDILYNLIRVLLLLLAVYLVSTLSQILYFYLISSILTVFLYILYFSKKIDSSFRPKLKFENIKNVLILSLPIMSVAILPSLNVWIINMMTSYVQSAESVALFFAPNRLTVFLTLPLVALGYIYLPSASKMTAMEQRKELGQFYANITKWTMLLALPMLVYTFMQAEYIVILLFGEEYLNSANVLRIIAVGSSINVLLGHNYLTMAALGRAKILLTSSLLSLFVMLVVAMGCISQFGHIGAALASVSGLITLNAYISLRLYKLYQIHPFERKVILSMCIAITFCLGLILVVENIFRGLWIPFVFTPIAYFGVIITPILSRNVTDDDIQLYHLFNRIIPNPLLKYWKKIIHITSVV